MFTISYICKGDCKIIKYQIGWTFLFECISKQILKIIIIIYSRQQLQPRSGTWFTFYFLTFHPSMPFIQY